MGPQGPAGVSGYEVVSASTLKGLPTSDALVSVTAHCPAGKHVLGGGFTHGHSGTSLAWSAPTNQADGWHVVLALEEIKQSSGSIILRVFAICAVVS